MLEIPCHKKVDPVHGRKGDMHRVRSRNCRDKTAGHQHSCQAGSFTSDREHPKPAQQREPFRRHVGISLPGFIQRLG